MVSFPSSSLHYLRFVAPVLALCILLSPSVVSLAQENQSISPAATQDATTIYLPLSQAASITTPAPEPKPGKQGFFQEPTKKTATPDVAIDAQGGTHMVYAYHVPLGENPDTDNPDLVYAYCPAPASACGDASRWQRINLGGPVDQAQIELTPMGQPRLLARGNSQEKSSFKNFYYGECDSNCFSETSWNFTKVTDAYSTSIGSVTGYYLPKRYFALDPQGKPRFVFYNGDHFADPDRYGGYYAQCDYACTDAQNWSVTNFTHSQPGSYKYEQLDDPSLAFTSNGEPRVVANLYPLVSNDTTNGIYYFGCDSGCDDDTNWERVKIAERGGGPYPSWDIAIDSAGRPRIAFYKEDELTGDSGKRLHYLSCDNDCFNAASWNTLNFGLPRYAGDGADIAVDSQNRPRIAYIDGSDNLRFSWCNGGCTSGANWKHTIIETGNQLEAEYPVPLPLTCDAGLWDTFAPSMALDNLGNPHITYNGSYKAHCLYQDPSDPSKPPSTSFSEIWHSTRLVTFPQP